ncbi:glycosyltransferase family 4 protein [Christiangramia aestuarii]|nr:glycosyltransferase family 4 protein [Christiangramia aestuarii]
MILNFFSFFYKLLYRLLVFKPDVVYYPITPTQIGWLGRDVLTILISRLFGAKVVIHLRGSHFKLNFKSFHPAAKKLIGYALSKVDVGIVQANYLRDEFEPFLSSEKTFTLYQSIIPEEFPNEDIFNFNRGKILVVGHLTKAKGYTDIVDIIPSIAEKFPFVRFEFAGNMRKGERGVFYNQFDGTPIDYEDPFVAEREIINGKYAKNYSNLGIIDGEVKLKHFQNSDLFISASYSEGFSRSLLEAMTCGKPLIYTPVGAHREVLDDGLNGVCVPPGNKKELEAAISSLLANKELRNSMAQTNFKVSREKFSIDRIAKDFTEILNSTLN